MTAPDRLSAALADRYHIERQLGQGGMATVYLAKDLKHDRHVALKVLKPELAAVLGAERFLHEIKTTAALQHPHILALFDSGAADGFLFYVMPYIQGETLRDRLDRETHLGIDDAIRITTDVAEALQYAHGVGVIHRDIKPENILLSNGRPIVADFGIALAVSAAAGGRMTETGLSLGTPHYMSPEQATAEKTLTGRSDIYSLAAVLFEMLGGDPPHVGSSAQQIIMKIIAEPAPPVTAFRRSVPANVSAALAKALEKLPADRFGSAKDFAAALRDSSFGAGTGSGTPDAIAASGRRMKLAFTFTAALLVLLAGWSWAGLRETASPTERLRIGLSVKNDGGMLPSVWPFLLAISHDGSAIVFTDSSDGLIGSLPLYIKERGHTEAVALPGTEGATSPFFSPDGRWIAFATSRGLYKTPREGGAVILLSDSTANFARNVYAKGAWLDDNSIIFPARNNRSLYRIDANGGNQRIVLVPGRVGAGGLLRLSALPKARGLVMTICPSAPCTKGEIWMLDLSRDSVARLAERTTAAWWMPTGHLLLGRADGNISAQRLDIERMVLVGDQVPVLGPTSVVGGIPLLEFSPSGTLLYTTGATDVLELKSMVWVERDGRQVRADSLPVAWGFEQSFAFSPDGTRLAFVMQTERGTAIAVKQLPDGSVTQVTFDDKAMRPAWSGDSRDLFYIAQRNGKNIVLRRNADGTGTETVAAEDPKGIFDITVSPDAELLVYRTDVSDEGAGDIIMRDLRDKDSRRVIVGTPAEEGSPAISPDGRWLAYVSNETGQHEVTVRPFPDVRQGRWQISRDGGMEPVWSPDSRELYYRGIDNGKLMSASVTSTPSFRVIETRMLFDASLYQGGLNHPAYAVSRDNKRFVFLPYAADAGRPSRMVLVRNLFTELGPKLQAR